MRYANLRFPERVIVRGPGSSYGQTTLPTRHIISRPIRLEPLPAARHPRTARWPAWKWCIRTTSGNGYEITHRGIIQTISRVILLGKQSVYIVDTAEVVYCARCVYFVFYLLSIWLWHCVTWVA